MTEGLEGRTPGTGRRRWIAGVVAVVALSGAALAASCGDKGKDEAPEDRAPAPLTVDSLAETDADLFPGIDGGVQLTSNELKGRNTWMIWTGGNESFWNWLAKYGFGTNDLLKTLDTRRRGERFAKLGLVNHPGFRQASKPDQYGLWLDEYVGQPEGISERVYGKPAGIVGLRLFPNPDFDPKKWDPVRYYNDPNYYNDPKLERPYSVGMACSFCHVGPHPLNPPADPENPQWENLSTNIGAQYFRTAGVFGNGMDESSLVYQILRVMPDGTLDTSFLATDNILNPSNMNAIFEVQGRLAAAEAAPEEEVGKAAQAIPGTTSPAHVPHILKDGADAIGLIGALGRVYVNIGEYWEEWIRNHNILVGGIAQTPFPIEVAQEKSDYWQASQQRLGNLAGFFLKSAGAMHLANAPGGQAYLTRDTAVLNRGAIAYADNCASCHSSKRPPAGTDPNSAQGRAWLRQSVLSPDFRNQNYLSDDRRYPVTDVKTNACRALATNATRGHVWDNFSSETYKQSPSVGQIEGYNPITRQTFAFKAPAGGPGYYRTPSLVSIWATAPYLHNNALGIHTHDPSVAGRMRAFNDGIEKLLWPEKRLGERSIFRTTGESWLLVPEPYLPGFLKPLAENNYLRIGPVPAGTPIKLLANIDATFESRQLDGADAQKALRLFNLVRHIKNDLIKIKLQKLPPEQATELLKGLVPELLANSKCPDFIEDKGHYYGTDLPDPEKRALIEYLKTL